jgi:hypothetical protein
MWSEFLVVFFFILIVNTITGKRSVAGKKKIRQNVPAKESFGNEQKRRLS